ncbi:YbbR-like domain-containing protein [Fructobacillus durionis]|uniref:YbbR domain-containing protein n=1 Tax=Fructobacillus durionis TaxID=283737 RepID=A0A1I1E440_9LACO|nr:CdaR family protein [Fructobacillus durionis]SFB82009.1 YbbR domain-containing protein [Fructobacillus durionis]
MKKLGSSKIINIIFSLLMAILLAAYVLSIKNYSNSTNSNSYSSLIPEKKATITVPLTFQYNSDDYVIVGAASTVSVNVQGSSALVTAAKNHNDIAASADLRGLGAGQHTVNVALSGVNSSLSANASPQTVTVTLAEKSSAKKNVKVQYDDSKIATGYSVTDETSDVNSVTVSGPKTNVDAVSYVGADVDLDKNTKSNVSEAAKLTAYDKDGNAVQVTLSQTKANVKLTLTKAQSSKKVQLAAQASSGSLSAYDISFDPSTVTIYGSSDTLNSIDTLPVNLDLSNITSKTTKSITLDKPSGVDQLSDQKVSVTITPKSTNSSSSASSSSASSSSSSN